MANLETALTPFGYKTLISKGLEKEIIYYNINDNYHNYVVSAKENLVPAVVGSHNTITMSHCAFADYDGVFPTKPDPTEIENVISRVQYSFVNEECSYGDFNQPNLNINVNINSWLYELSNLTYNFNMQGLTIDLWDYVTATIQTLNLSTKNYDNVKYLTNLGLNWVPKTNSTAGKMTIKEQGIPKTKSMMGFDLNNLLKISPKYVNFKEGSKREMVDNSSIRFGSPFFLSFSTYSVGGTPINNTAGRFSLVPNEFGYWVDGTTFLNTATVESSDLTAYKTIQPAAIVGNNTYYLNEIGAYPTKAGFVGYATKMINTNGNGDTLLTGLINQAKLFMKTYAIYDSVNDIYTLPINMSTIATNSEINYITNKVGGNVKLNFIYNPNDNNSPIIQLV